MSHPDAPQTPRLRTVTGRVLAATLTPLGHVDCVLDTADGELHALSDFADVHLPHLTPGAQVSAVLLRLKHAAPDATHQWQLLCCRAVGEDSAPSLVVRPPQRPTVKSFPYLPETAAKAPDTDTPDITELFPRGPVTCVLGRIERIDLGWAGRMQCTLQLSIGRLAVRLRRDQLGDLAEGSWVHVRLRRGFDKSQPHPSVFSMEAAAPDLLRQGDTAWAPIVTRLRHAHEVRLRTLLSRLAPEVQAAFMAVMIDGRLQRGFLWRIGAADHHGYPGGLFDQSVRAAEIAYAQCHATEQDRDLATLAALLFDLGKVQDPRLSMDAARLAGGLEPHHQTLWRLEPGLRQLDLVAPAVGAQLRALLGATGSDATAEGQPLQPLQRLRTHVRQAVQASWCASECSNLNQGASA